MDMTMILYPILSLGGLGLLFGLGLGYASIRFKVEEDPKIGQVREALPGANCGGCGFPGCDGLAQAIVAGEAPVNACPVGGVECGVKVAEIMGVEPVSAEKMVAFIKCAGNSSTSEFRYEYFGLTDCNATTHLAGGGSKACQYGCLGNGSCFKVCQFGAIEMIGGIAHIIKDKCVACGMCVKRCPRQLIELIPYSAGVQVACNSKDPGKIVRGHCNVGCIACKMCEKACEFDAVHVNENLAKIDYDKCTKCNACVKKCPMYTIHSETFVKEKPAAKPAPAKKEEDKQPESV